MIFFKQQKEDVVADKSFSPTIFSVNAITKMKNELLTHNQDNEVLKTWSGDPCLPLQWHGLSCELLNGSSVITKL